MDDYIDENYEEDMNIYSKDGNVAGGKKED
jgi:hypothetical protein